MIYISIQYFWRFQYGKRIKDFEDYAITTEGKVISFKYREPRIMSTWFQASGYENIKLFKTTQQHIN